MKIVEFLLKVREVPSWNRTPAISDEDLEDLISQIDMLREKDSKDKYDPYPILGTKPQQYIPRGLLIPHENQAWTNHGQSLSELAQRGGLGWAEALAIIEGKKWRDAEHDEKVAESIVRRMASEYMKGYLEQ